MKLRYIAPQNGCLEYKLSFPFGMADPFKGPAMLVSGECNTGPGAWHRFGRPDCLCGHRSTQGSRGWVWGEGGGVCTVTKVCPPMVLTMDLATLHGQTYTMLVFSLCSKYIYSFGINYRIHFHDAMEIWPWSPWTKGMTNERSLLGSLDKTGKTFLTLCRYKP